MGIGAPQRGQGPRNIPKPHFPFVTVCTTTKMRAGELGVPFGASGHAAPQHLQTIYQRYPMLNVERQAQADDG